MAGNIGPNIVQDSIYFYVDAANPKSFTSVGTGWTDIVGTYSTLPMTGATYDSGVNGSIQFNGALGSSASTPFTLAPSTTFDCWANLTTANANNMVWTVNYLANTAQIGKVQAYLNFTSSGALTFTWLYYNTPIANNAAQTYFLTTAAGLVQTGTWYNLVCTLKIDTVAQTSTGTVYVNGTQVATFTTAAASVLYMNPSDTLQIATYNSYWPASQNNYPFNGKISNLKIHNRILSATEVQQNFNAMRPRFGV